VAGINWTEDCDHVIDAKSLGFALILFAVMVLTGAQVVIKSRLSVHGVIPLQPGALTAYLWMVVRDWQMWLGLVGLLVSSLCWYAAISRLPLSIAYPFAALSYPVIFVGSLVFLREDFTWQALAGNVLIVVGLLLVASASRG